MVAEFSNRTNIGHLTQFLSVRTSFALLLLVHRVSALDCGAVNFVRPAILGGSDTVLGEWPFLAAIQNRSDYICGGTIISYRHILTAAHCIQKKNSETELLPHDVVVRLGAYNLTNNNEKGVIKRNVSAIFVHPDWMAFETKFDADIAILVLSENITFTDNIQPVCMPSNRIVDNMQGTVVGYGSQKDTVYTHIPSRISVRAVNSSHCLREDHVVATFSSQRTFCGGNGDGSPELGDSGSGYFSTPGFSWAQYGIVAGIRTNATGHAFLHGYHVYTNLTMFKDWIIQTVNETGGEVGEPRISVAMTCDYDYKAITPDELVYCCSWHGIDIQGNNIETGSFNGSHLSGKSEWDVEGIHLVNGTMTYLPTGLGLYFENIRHLTVGELTPDFGSLGTKVVRRSDLRNLKKLEGLSFLRNDIETLHEDALWDLPHLKFFKFVENKLKVLFNGTFSRNTNLVQVDFSSNQLHFLPPFLFRNNPMVSAVNFQMNFVKEIDESFFKIHRKLRYVDFGYNQLGMLPKRLFRNTLSLMTVIANDNALSSIDEDLFETSVHLVQAWFMFNRIESLPPKLFRNNFQLSVVFFHNNLITTIDENFFMNNRELNYVFFSNNKLESLPGNLFKSASLLSQMDFSNNKLKNIAINFTELAEISVINLLRNDCISAMYVRRSLNPARGRLGEFQNLVKANCSTHF